MAETADEIYCEQAEKTPNDEAESNEYACSTQPNSSFLLEMNLVMIIASLTQSDQELLDFEDMDKSSAKEQNVNALESKLKSRKREFDQVKIPDRRTPRSQTRVLDSRHGRKM